MTSSRSGSKKWILSAAVLFAAALTLGPASSATPLSLEEESSQQSSESENGTGESVVVSRAPTFCDVAIWSDTAVWSSTLPQIIILGDIAVWSDTAVWSNSVMPCGNQGDLGD